MEDKLYSIGDKVRVIDMLDEQDEDWETYGGTRVGHTGVVMSVVQEHGCGAAPGNPMMRVLLDNDIEDMFWPEELELLECAKRSDCKNEF